jgi:AAA+ superfamily predicted ATPase
MPTRRITSALKKHIACSANTRFREYLGGIEGLETLEKEFPGHQIANIQILVRQFFEHEIPGAQIYGTGSRRGSLLDGCHSFNDLLQEPRIDKDGDFDGIDFTNLRYVKAVPEKFDARLGLMSALTLLEYEGKRLAVYFWTENRIQPHCTVGIACRDVASANRLLNRFIEYLTDNSIFRKRMLLPSISFASEVENLTITEFERTQWEDLILPEDLKEAIYENVIGFIKHQDVILRNGFELKRGILFHGVPGTGKSMACRVIAAALKDFTTIVMTGEDQRSPRAAFDLARRLQPALIIFEDIDNIAIRREDNSLRSVLSELMNELDGLSDRENIYVLFTTNNIRYLEDALVERPGRVDLIFEFPLPAPELRRKLVCLYARNAHVSINDWSALLRRTEGTSPAFIKELVKRALLHSIRNGGVDEQGFATLKDEHFCGALDELGKTTNTSARRIIGF